jgi:hypothetical protein
VRPIDIQIIRRIVLIALPGKIIQVDLPTLPVPMSGTSCGSVEACLDRSPQLECENEMIDECQKESVFAGTADACDGAYSNAKYESWRECMPDINSCVTWLTLFCGNHGNRISERLVVELDPEQSMSKLTGFIGLLRNSTLLLRLITMATPAIIDLIVLAPEARAPEGAGAHHLKFRLPLPPPTPPDVPFYMGGIRPRAPTQYVLWHSHGLSMIIDSIMNYSFLFSKTWKSENLET